MTPRRPKLSVTSQTKPLEESIPVAAAVTYVLRSCREPNCAAITPPRVCVLSGFTYCSISTASWFGDVAVGGFYFPHTHEVVVLQRTYWLLKTITNRVRKRGLTRWCRKKLLLRARLA